MTLIFVLFMKIKIGTTKSRVFSPIIRNQSTYNISMFEFCFMELITLEFRVNSKCFVSIQIKLHEAFIHLGKKYVDVLRKWEKAENVLFLVSHQERSVQCVFLFSNTQWVEIKLGKTSLFIVCLFSKKSEGTLFYQIPPN